MYATYKRVQSPEMEEAVGTGWLPPAPDLRDFTETEPEIVEMIEKLGLAQEENLKGPPEDVDLRPWCSAVENQRSLG